MTNIEKLARLIVRTGNADQIMAALEAVLPLVAGNRAADRAEPTAEEGGEV